MLVGMGYKGVSFQFSLFGIYPTIWRKKFDFDHSQPTPRVRSLLLRHPPITSKAKKLTMFVKDSPYSGDNPYPTPRDPKCYTSKSPKPDWLTSKVF